MLNFFRTFAGTTRRDVLVDRLRLSLQEEFEDNLCAARIWRRADGSIRPRRPRRGRFFRKEGCQLDARHRPHNHEWSFGVLAVHSNAHEPEEALIVTDDCTGECLAICSDQRIEAVRVLDVFERLFEQWGAPARLNCARSPDHIAISLRDWLEDLGRQVFFADSVRAANEPGKGHQDFPRTLLERPGGAQGPAKPNLAAERLAMLLSATPVPDGEEAGRPSPRACGAA